MAWHTALALAFFAHAAGYVVAALLSQSRAAEEAEDAYHRGFAAGAREQRKWPNWLHVEGPDERLPVDLDGTPVVPIRPDQPYRGGEAG